MIFGRKKEEEEFVEIDTSAFGEQEEIRIMVERLNDLSDAERVQQLLREGNIVLVRIKDLWETDANLLKRAVERIKRTCNAMDGDMVIMDKDILIVTPPTVKIQR